MNRNTLFEKYGRSIRNLVENGQSGKGLKFTMTGRIKSINFRAWVLRQFPQQVRTRVSFPNERTLGVIWVEKR